MGRYGRVPKGRIPPRTFAGGAVGAPRKFAEGAERAPCTFLGDASSTAHAGAP